MGVEVSKGKDRLEELGRQVRDACRIGRVEVRVMHDCMMLRDDALRVSQELFEQETEPAILEAAGDFREVACLLDRLIKDLLNYDFAEVEECLSDLHRCLHSAESHASF